MNEAQHRMDVSVSVDRTAAVVRVRGEVDLRSSPELREKLLDLLNRPLKRVIIDLAQVSYIDSSGVGTLVELKRRLDRSDGRVVLVALQPRVRSVFEITRLDHFFAIVNTIDEAHKA